jgi:DNA polymerase
MSQNFSQSGSQMSREDMLRELELLPVWQLRQPLPMQSKAELPAADKSDQVSAEIPVIDIVIAESAALELPISVSSTPEPAPSVPPVLEVPTLDDQVPQPVDVVESVEDEPVLAQVQPLRLLLSEDSNYAFLIEPHGAESDVQQVETLLRNMIRAMQASCRVDVIDSADKIFTVHKPRLIISLGAEPANRLSGKTHTVDAWRIIQQENPPSYEQIPLIVTYHPAHLLENIADKALAWRDLCAAMKLVRRL